MEFEAALARQEGILMSMHQRNCSWRRGFLSIKEMPDPELHRVVRVARFHEGRLDGPDLHPPLFDATVIEARVDWWTVTGFERVPTGAGTRSASFQQSWFLKPVSPASRP